MADEPDWQSINWGTYYDGSHPLFENEGGVNLLEKAEEEALCLFLLTLRKLYAAEYVQTIPL